MGVSARYARLVPELVCADIGRSLVFYVGVLGFAVVYAREEERFVVADPNGYLLRFFQDLGERPTPSA